MTMMAWREEDFDRVHGRKRNPDQIATEDLADSTSTRDTDSPEGILTAISADHGNRHHRGMAWPRREEDFDRVHGRKRNPDQIATEDLADSTSTRDTDSEEGILTEISADHGVRHSLTTPRHSRCGSEDDSGMERRSGRSVGRYSHERRSFKTRSEVGDSSEASGGEDSSFLPKIPTGRRPSTGSVDGMLAEFSSLTWDEQVGNEIDGKVIQKAKNGGKAAQRLRQHRQQRGAAWREQNMDKSPDRSELREPTPPPSARNKTSRPVSGAIQNTNSEELLDESPCELTPSLPSTPRTNRPVAQGLKAGYAEKQ